MIGPSKSKQIFIMVFLLATFQLNHALAIVQSKKDINVLIPKIRAKIKEYPSLLCGVYVKSNFLYGEININGDTIFPAASLIKIPVSVVLLLEIDKGTLNWEKDLILKKASKAPGTGFLKAKPNGTIIKLKEAFKLMLTESDNTAFNMVIEALGGTIKCNEKILNLGLKNTKLTSYLVNFREDNITSPKDLAVILEKSLEGNLLSFESKRFLKNTLLDVKNKSLINQGIGKYTKFAHKTGTIGVVVGDAGIIYLPFGKRISISVIVRRPFNSLSGQKAIREISNLIYNELR